MILALLPLLGLVVQVVLLLILFHRWQRFENSDVVRRLREEALKFRMTHRRVK